MSHRPSEDYTSSACLSVVVLEEPGIRAFRGPVISSAERDPTNKQERGSVPNAWFARDETKIADILRYQRWLGLSEQFRAFC
ncbi:hypothetical protein CFBP6623_25530 (plasmid) [Agrobacterium tumefaciens]|jgi:hypothetical protein|nr:hypothetical protein CFBP6623_25530 [Agrobacterium tumefaciens]